MVDTDDTRWTTPGVRHKLPTGEVKMSEIVNNIFLNLFIINILGMCENYRLMKLLK